jgi:formylglycine-generating enzyme required for sulfatase activity
VDATGFSKAWGAREWNEKLDHPVINVSWRTARDFSKWFTQAYDSRLPSDYIFRLPTEAEWEKAARGTDRRLYPWGNEFDKNKCNSEENSYKYQTTPVGNYSPQGDSPYGISDMSGNVWEWTHSLYQSYPYRNDDGRESASAEGSRVLRGGSFFHNALDVHAVARDRGGPGLYAVDSGFRVALAPPLPK